MVLRFIYKKNSHLVIKKTPTYKNVLACFRGERRGERLGEGSGEGERRGEELRRPRRAGLVRG